jgi:hypothetical protein
MGTIFILVATSMHRARVNFLCFLKASASDIFRVQKLGASTDATTI